MQVSFQTMSVAPTFGRVVRDVDVNEMLRKNMSIDQARKFVDLEKTQEKNPIDIYLSVDNKDDSRLFAIIDPPKESSIFSQTTRQNIFQSYERFLSKCIKKAESMREKYYSEKEVDEILRGVNILYE